MPKLLAMPANPTMYPAMRRRVNGRPSNQQKRPTPVAATALATCAEMDRSAISMSVPDTASPGNAVRYRFSLS